MGKLCKYIDVCIANEEDAENIFNIKAGNTDHTTGNLDYKRYEEIAHKLMQRFDFQKVAITLTRSLSASDNHWVGMLFDGKNCYYSKYYLIHIVDRVGGGDSFAAE